MLNDVIQSHMNKYISKVHVYKKTENENIQKKEKHRVAKKSYCFG